MSRWLAWVPLAVLLALGALFGLYALGRDPQVQPQAMVGRQVPNLELPNLSDGQPASLRALASEGPVLVNFFASWCAPCEIEHPELMALKAQRVRLVGIAYKDAAPNSAAFLARLGDPYGQVLVDRDGRAGVEFGVTGVPETFLVGQDGIIAAKHTGPLTRAKAQELAAKATR